MQNTRRIYIIGSSLFIFALALTLFITVQKEWDELWVKSIVGISVFILVHQCYVDLFLKKERGAVQIDLFFLLMYFFVMFWVWLADIIGLADIGTLRSVMDPKFVNYSLSLSLLGMAAFVLGFNLLAGGKGGKGGKGGSQIKIIGKREWLVFGNIIYFTGAVLVVSYALYFGKEAFQGRYEGTTVGGLTATSIYLLQGILLKLGLTIILIAKSDPKKIIPDCKIQIIIYICVLLMYLVLGDRSEFVYSTAVALFAYSIAYRNVSLKVLVVAILLFAFLSSAVQIARKLDERSLSSIVEIATSDREDVSVEAGLSNISSSGLLTLVAVSAVPNKYEYFGGRLKKVELMGVIPFGRALFPPKMEKRYYASSKWLTWYILGPYSTWGIGTNIVADLYLDFGPAGVVLGLFILGFSAGYFKQKTEYSNSFIYIVVYSYYAGLLTIIPRYSFLVIIRGMLWPMALMWFVNKYCVPKGKRKGYTYKMNEKEKKINEVKNSQYWNGNPPEN